MVRMMVMVWAIIQFTWTMVHMIVLLMFSDCHMMVIQLLFQGTHTMSCTDCPYLKPLADSTDACTKLVQCNCTIVCLFLSTYSGQ